MVHPVVSCELNNVHHFTIQVDGLKMTTNVRVEALPKSLVKWGPTTVTNRDPESGIMTFDATPTLGKTSGFAILEKKLEEKLDQILRSAGVGSEQAINEARALVKILVDIIFVNGGDGLITITTSNGGTDDPGPTQYYATYS